jgi:thymidylate kinase
MILFSLEGVEASGKTSVLNETISLLRAQHVICAPRVEFPPIPELLAPIETAMQKSIFVSEHFAGGPVAALFFMLAADCAATRPASDEVAVVIAERGIDSIGIYQKYFIELVRPIAPSTLIADIEHFYRRLFQPIPIATFVLVASEQTVCQRFRARNGRHFTRDELAVVRHFMKDYNSLILSGGRYIQVDAEVSVFESASYISRRIMEILQRK